MPAIPDEPALHATDCNGQVCIPVDDGKALIEYMHAIDDAKAAIAKCPLVRVVDH